MEKQTELELELPGNDGSLGELLSMLETQGITIIRTQAARVVDPVIVIGIAASPSGSAEFTCELIVSKRPDRKTRSPLRRQPRSPVADGFNARTQH